jgi:thiamine transporter
MGNSLLGEIITDPALGAALAGVLLMVFALLKIRNIKLSARMIAHIGLALALAVLLHSFRLYHFPQGGTVTPGSMLPLLIIAWRYGAEVGYLSGFVFGMINLILNPFILHPAQVLFDYPLPFMALGVAGYFKERLIMGILLGIFGRFICHVISGVIFFSSYAPHGTSPLVYALWLNGSYLLPETLICLLLVNLLPMKWLRLQLR